MEQQLIRYVHDGSETLADRFVLVANASEMDRQSHPVVLTITILPVNDQPPILTTNTGLQVRASRTASRCPCPHQRGPAPSSPAVSLTFLLCKMGILPHAALGYWEERRATALEIEHRCEAL